MTDETEHHDQDGPELSAADEQVLRDCGGGQGGKGWCPQARGT
jgi:hypothetical protein